jgi:hypothetical protein
MILQGHHLLHQELVAGVPRGIGLHEFYRMLLELFHLVCGGPILIAGIHLRPAWVTVNEKLFWKNLPAWGIL